MPTIIVKVYRKIFKAPNKKTKVQEGKQSKGCKIRPVLSWEEEEEEKGGEEEAPKGGKGRGGVGVPYTSGRFIVSLGFEYTRPVN